MDHKGWDPAGATTGASGPTEDLVIGVGFVFFESTAKVFIFFDYLMIVVDEFVRAVHIFFS